MIESKPKDNVGMDYILFNLGESPTHLEYCMNTILSIDKKAKITICTDDDLTLTSIKVVNIKELPDLEKKREEIGKLFISTNYEKNPLWTASMLRVFALKEITNMLNIKKFVHFDNDVLIYNNFETIQNIYTFSEKKINITESDSNNLVFGYSYFPNYDSIDRLCNILDKILKNYTYYSNNFARGGALNEMRMLRIAQIENPDLFQALEILPYGSSNILFDPSSYGQYLNGTHTKKENYLLKKRFISTAHIVGKELKSKRIKIKFKKKRPIVYYNQKEYELVNLHIHSKNLLSFLPSGYERHIKL